MMSPQVLADEMVANFNLPSTKSAAEDPRFHDNDKFGVFMNLMNDPNATTGIYTAVNSEVNTALGSDRRAGAARGLLIRCRCFRKPRRSYSRNSTPHSSSHCSTTA